MTTRNPATPSHVDVLPAASRGAKGDVALFLGQWLRSPGRIGAVAPSSSHLARVACAPVPEYGRPVVIELGPGTGSFTDEIQRRLDGRGQHMAVESNEILATALQRRYNRVDVVNGDALHLQDFVGERGISHADVIVSGLPWSLFPDAVQDQLVDAVIDVMGPHSVFTTFAYRHAAALPAARRFRALLDDRFEEVVPSRTVWRNLPPAFVLHVRRPRSLARQHRYV
jgi:phosphatidylethanolamine/phosphatidyl-N-methylethanolamine N-methyltransferase